MIFLRRSLLLTLSLLLALFIAACGATPTTNTNSNATSNTAQTDKAADIQNNQAANDQKVVAVTPTAQPQGNMQNTGQKVKTNTAQPASNAQNNNQKTSTTTTQKQDNTKNNDQMQQGQDQMQGSDQQNNDQGNSYDPGSSQQNDNGQMNGNGQNTKTLISTKQINLNGQMVTVLTTFNGQTLYTYNADMASNSSCTGACAQQWPPLLSNGQVISTTSITGNLTVHTTANGHQVTYNGQPLYTYAGDMGAGQVNGQGVQNMWQVAAVKLQKQHW